MCNLAENKQELRKYWRKIRDSVPNRREKNRRIQEKVLTYPALKKANSVFLYLSFGSEVDTMPLLTALWERGISVLVPRCHKGTGIMDPVAITDLSQVKPGSYGILEPDPALPGVSAREIDLVLVPGLAFDKEGFRLGYGGGYYDRFLEGFSGAVLGLAFSDCLTENLPREEFDRPVDTVITDL